MTKPKPNIIIRMGASHWDAQVRGSDGKLVHFDFSKMTRRQRSDFHRELMNAFRANRK